MEDEHDVGERRMVLEEVDRDYLEVEQCCSGCFVVVVDHRMVHDLQMSMTQKKMVVAVVELDGCRDVRVVVEVCDRHLKTVERDRRSKLQETRVLLCGGGGRGGC